MPDRTRDQQVESLAVADPDELCRLADEFLEQYGKPTVIMAPETGLVMMQVREPVCRERFHLGEVVVSRAEVDWRGATGWSMRLGTHRAAALAAALCDAASAFDAVAAERVDALCRTTDARRAADADAEWHALAATRVNFEELD